MGLFGKSFEEQVDEAIQKLRAANLGVTNLCAKCEGKVVTLTGQAPSMEVKARVAQEFNALVQTENTFNQIHLERPAAAPPPSAAPVAAQAVAAAAMAAVEAPVVEERFHVVVGGETLSAIAKKYYGDARKYPKIFEANRDTLSNPDLIKVGQRLRIPS